MPRRDGTGPSGMGPMTGNKMGPCGRGSRGRRQSFGNSSTSSRYQKGRTIEDKKRGLDEEEEKLKEELAEIQREKSEY